MNESNAVLFKTSGGAFSAPVGFGEDSAWLTKAQLSGNDRTVTGRHIGNAVRKGEVDHEAACAKSAHTARHGAMAGRTLTGKTAVRGPDVAISAGCRMHSLRGAEFRRRATKVLKECALKARSVNRRRIARPGFAAGVTKRVSNSTGAVEKARSAEITCGECRAFTGDVKFAGSSALFGNGKDGAGETTSPEIPSFFVEGIRGK